MLLKLETPVESITDRASLNVDLIIDQGTLDILKFNT